MLRYLAITCLSFIPFFVSASPGVPTTMEFAGIKLTIDAAARKEIQEDVDALRRSPTYFNKKVEKVDLYFPIIERVFREENLPEDFKYLAIQESALIPDAVSSSNAVGFWQFKEMTAKEVGLRVDRNIDERMNITASSRGAAKYLKKNNFFFDNWVYALLAYNTGPGGAEQHVNKKYMGASKMTINKQTHWYVKKFLAHKIAFEDAVGKNSDLGMTFYEYNDTKNKSLQDLSDHFRIDFDQITEYNKWIKRGKIPEDKTYTAIIPVSANDSYAIRIINPSKKQELKSAPKPELAYENTYKPIAEFNFQQNSEFPVVKTNSISKKIKINGIPGFIASSKDNLSTITIDYGITQKQFMKYNEMAHGDEIIVDQVYYLKSKKNKAKIHYHVAIQGENAWSISQKYGIKKSKLLSKNRLTDEKELEVGMVVWLRFIRPANVPVEYRKNDAKNILVQSTPNEILQPDKTPIHDRPDKQLITEKPSVKSTEIIEDDSDFLFEEINQDTEFINENSYIDMNNVEASGTKSSTNSMAEGNDTNTSKISSKKTKKYHIVKTGETLFSISRMYTVSIGQIRQWNDIEDLDVLKPGQTITIYHDEPLEASNTELSHNGNYKTYVVKKNDTLYSIARENNLSIKELMELNEKEDFSIKEGEVIKIGLVN